MHFVFPHNFVYWTKVSNHQEIKEKYYKKIIEVSNDWDSSPYFYTQFKSSFRNFRNNTINQEIKNDIKFLNDIIWNPIDQMFAEDFFPGILPETSEIAEIWFNVYKPGESQEVHDHNGHYTTENGKHICCSYSGIYILHAEENNKTVFYQQGPNPGASCYWWCKLYNRSHSRGKCYYISFYIITLCFTLRKS